MGKLPDSETNALNLAPYRVIYASIVVPYIYPLKELDYRSSRVLTMSLEYWPLPVFCVQSTCVYKEPKQV